MLISAEALYSRAAQLFQVNLDKPEQLIGKNTTESMQSGIFNGYCAMIEALVVKITEDLKTKPTRTESDHYRRTCNKNQ